ncbi:MAG TPA: phospholipase D-like domain-containing protein [Ktedonobacteraceae bacterium]|nr:phospholipase D-like domain-containing protein [Ktedonobacteraceae bacterium]
MYGHTSGSIPLRYLIFIVALCLLLTACNISIGTPSGTGTTSCQNNCTTGSGVQGVQVFVEPDAGEHPITNAIEAAKKSIWLEMYILSDRNVIRALEDAANKGVDVRIMLEPHPFGSSSPTRTMDQLKAAGAKVEDSSPSFALTHEKGMLIDGTTAYIMTSNFSRSALGSYGSNSKYTSNREYDIIDTNAQDVQAITAIFQADWNRTTASFNDANLVVSPVNSRNDLTALINSAHHTLLIENEEMNDSSIEQALVNAAQHGVQVQVILPSSSSSNNQGIDTIKQGGVQVREDSRLYIHAKMFLVDGQKAFVGSENISTQSLDQNRELGILISDQGVLHTLQQTFQQDWGDSQGA